MLAFSPQAMKFTSLQNSAIAEIDIPVVPVML